jgi:hypothetical protein
VGLAHRVRPSVVRVVNGTPDARRQAECCGKTPRYINFT